MDRKERITLDDTLKSSIIKLSDGNPGAINVMMQIIDKGNVIDPDGMDSFMILLHLDSFGIYGSRIWCLFKDVCHQSIVNTVGMLRACQMGNISQETLLSAIDGQTHLDVEANLKWVRNKLPNFIKDEKQKEDKPKNITPRPIAQLNKKQAKKFAESKIWEHWNDRLITEFQLLQERGCIPFSRYHKAIENVIGHPVFTHEFVEHRQDLINEVFSSR